MKLLTILFLVFSYSAITFGQSFTVSPSYGFQGTTLPVTITGSGTNFSQGSPSGIEITQGASSVTVTNFNTTTTTNIDATVDIPIGAPFGYYNVEVWDNGGLINDPAGFTVLPNNGHTIFGRVLIDGNQNCQDDGNEIGISGIDVLIEPIGIIVQTSTAGYWSLPSLANGTYQLVVGGTG